MASELSPVLNEQLQTALERFDKLYAILVSTVEGVPLLNATSADKPDLPYDFAETVLPTVFAGAAEQVHSLIGKLQFGQVKSITSFFANDLVLLHVNDLPLVLTLVAADSAQIGALQALADQLRDALAPLKTCVEAADVQH